jgi:hypothetical protein
MRIKIIQDSKPSTQSAPLTSDTWYINFQTEDDSVFSDKLTGWLSSSDTNSQINMKFSSLDSAIEYAKSNKYEYEILKQKPKKLIKRAYADNFR